ncbi:6653_t:CDS:2, partial [Diversispora eburnea]
TNCTENKEKWFIEGGNKYRGHWLSDGMGAGVTTLVAKELNNIYQRNHKVIVMGDFNAVPSSRKDLIDSYRTIYPDSNGFTWKRDNSQEQSRIDAIWISQ